MKLKLEKMRPIMLAALVIIAGLLVAHASRPKFETEIKMEEYHRTLKFDKPTKDDTIRIDRENLVYVFLADIRCYMYRVMDFPDTTYHIRMGGSKEEFEAEYCQVMAEAKEFIKERKRELKLERNARHEAAAERKREARELRKNTRRILKTINCE